MYLKALAALLVGLCSPKKANSFQNLLSLESKFFSLRVALISEKMHLAGKNILFF